MASVIVERRGKRQRIVWREGGRESKRHIETFKNAPQAEARAKRLRILLAAKETLTPHRAIPWAEVVARYCLNEAHTTQDYRDALTRDLETLGERRKWATVADITPGVTAGLTAHTARHLRAVLRYALTIDQAVDQRVLHTTKRRTVKGPDSPLLTDAQVAEVMERATKWHKADAALVHCIATYGHRAETLTPLAWGSFNLAAPAVTIKVKSGHVFSHPLLPATVALLNDLGPGKAGQRVFVGHLGKPWAKGQDFAAWLNHGPGNGVGVLDLRRYAISRMFTLGLDPKTIASITGHRTPSLLLNTYARTSEKLQAQAVAALNRATLCLPEKS